MAPRRSSKKKSGARSSVRPSARSSRRCPMASIIEGSGGATTTIELELLETRERERHFRSDVIDKSLPRHTVGCTPYECHGAMMEKEGFGAVSTNPDGGVPSAQTKIEEARAFIEQYAKETNDYDYQALVKRLGDIESAIMSTGTYEQTFKELEFGCRLAWRNSGRCIMRKVAFTLELRDCRKVKTAWEAFTTICDHLRYAYNDGAVKPVISVFPPRDDVKKSSPIRIWNIQLLSYAAYQREDGTIMGDPARLKITSLCVKYGWKPPKVKSDFDILPLLISDESTNHREPEVFELPKDCAVEVIIRHPDYDLFDMLNLRWYVLPALSENAVDIGGVMYQGIPFNGWYAITEIGRDLLDKQRYDLAEAVAVACDIPRTKLAVWRDDVQLQVHKAILHSFAQANTSIVDHHTASEAFMDFFSNEHKKRGKCPADWVWLVPPAGGSMTSVFHQEMTNFIVKPQYRLQEAPWMEQNIEVPKPVPVEGSKVSSEFAFKRDACLYEKIYLYYGTQTGTSLRFATQMTSDFDGRCVGPLPLDDLTTQLKNESEADANTLILIFTSTFGKGNSPHTALNFLPEMENIKHSSGKSFDFGVFALGNSAYINSFVSFAKEVFDKLKSVGGNPIANIHIADELKNQDESMSTWRTLLLNNETGLIYNRQEGGANAQSESENVVEADNDRFEITYRGWHHATNDDVLLDDAVAETEKEMLGESYASHGDRIPRSTDLFSFEVDKANLDRLRSVSPGDHIALYPENVDDTVEFVMRLCKFESLVSQEMSKNIIQREIDLHRPLDEDALRTLEGFVEHDQGKFLMELILKNARNNNVFPSTAKIINQLPPGVVPFENFVMKHAPKMSPRFYSISSLDYEKNRLSICQSVFTFPGTNQAGTTSRWLRSLDHGAKVKALLSVSPDFHLPTRQDIPLILVATGSGIAPFRSFWTSNAKNEMHLFFGCRTRNDLPFEHELSHLQGEGRFFQYVACSREKGKKKMYVQDMIEQENDIVLDLIHNRGAMMYICGSPEMEYSVRTKLLAMLSTGSEHHGGMGIVRATEKLVLLQHQKRYIPEVYGTTKFLFGPQTILFQEAEAKISRGLATLEKMGLPKAPHQDDVKERKKISLVEQEDAGHRSSINMNPIISRGGLIELLSNRQLDPKDLDDDEEYWDDYYDTDDDTDDDEEEDEENGGNIPRHMRTSEQVTTKNWQLLITRQLVGKA